jgi:uncharacterized protein
MRTVPLAALAAVLLFGAPAQAAIVGIDCQRMEGDVETIVCANPKLLALEREVMRLYSLAENGYRAKVREGELAQTQQEWVMARDTCAKTPDPAVCLIDQSMARIREIRTGYYDATQDDAKGISSGPVRWSCGGLNGALVSVQARTDPALMQITWGTEFATLTREGTGRDYHDGGYVFSPTGATATFKMPAKPTLNCRIEAEK